MWLCLQRQSAKRADKPKPLHPKPPSVIIQPPKRAIRMGTENELNKAPKALYSLDMDHPLHAKAIDQRAEVAKERIVHRTGKLASLGQLSEDTIGLGAIL